MAEEAGAEDRTEQPTEKKVRDAIERGNLPVSREAPLFAFLAAALVTCTLTLREGASRLLEALVKLMDNPGGWTLANGADAMALGSAVAGATALFMLPIVALFLVAGVAAAFAQHMPRVVLSRVAPQWSKLSPVSGLKRLFGKDGLIEFGKALLKLAIVTIVVAAVMDGARDTVLDVLFAEPVGVPGLMLSLFTRLLSGVLAAFAVLVGVDLVLAKTRWHRNLMMSRQEIREEMKQAEGDPLVKAKRRSLALDRARRRMIKDVPRATLVIANPTHYAIALRYVRGETAAPVVVAKGQDLIALRIREVAAAHGIEVVEDKPLARSMYDHVDVAQAIPPQFYKAVAEIIHLISTKTIKNNSLERARVPR